MNEYEGEKGKVKNCKSVVSLVIGLIAGILAIGADIRLILGAIGLIFGIIGLREIRRFSQSIKNIAKSGIIF